MIIKPNINQLLEKINSRFDLVIAVSRRARQLSNGSSPLTKEKEESMVTIAAHEVAEGKVIVEE